MNKKKNEEETNNKLHSEFEAAGELPTSGELPDPEAMKLYETTKREEPATSTDKNTKVGDADDHTGYDYRGNK